MTDYISREEVGKALTTAEPVNIGNIKYNRYPPSHDEVLKRISAIPVADVVEVVRCKDCKNADSNGMGCCWVWCNEMQQAVSEDGWCYRGEDMRGEA